jgi:hypothetical protein
MERLAEIITDFFNSIGHLQTSRHRWNQVRFTAQTGHPQARWGMSAKGQTQYTKTS